MPTYDAQTGFPCPSCGFLVFSGPPGTYEICPVCDWEDDHVQLRFPNAGGANHDCLVESQRRVLARLPLSVKEHHGTNRDPTWRPLLSHEIEPSNLPATGHEYFEAAAESAPPYYWQDGRNEH